MNNTQLQIYDFGYAQQYPKIDAQNSYHYFIVKFIKLETDTEWYYAPGPVIIKLPRNIMYPFKIGTSKYSWIKKNKIKLKLIWFIFIFYF